MLQRTLHPLPALRPRPRPRSRDSAIRGGRAGRRRRRNGLNGKLGFVDGALEEVEVVVLGGFMYEDFELREWRGDGDVDGRYRAGCEAASSAEGCCEEMEKDCT